MWRPTRPELRRSKRPPENLWREPGEWQQGWQYWSSSIFDTHFRKIFMLSGQTAANRAHLRSSTRHHCSGIFDSPTSVPRPLVGACAPPFTDHGDNWPRAPRSAEPTRTPQSGMHTCHSHRAHIRVFARREPGVRFNVFLRDMNVGVRADDDRRIEVGTGSPVVENSQNTVDTTLRSSLGSMEEAHPRRRRGWDHSSPGSRSPELVESGRCWLVVWYRLKLGAVGATRLLTCLDCSQISSNAIERRWTRMATTCCVAFASSLVVPSEQCDTWCHTNGEALSSLG